MSIEVMKQARNAFIWNLHTDLDNIHACEQWTKILKKNIDALDQAITEHKHQQVYSLSCYINSAEINANDSPHVVIKKLEKVIEDTNKINQVNQWAVFCGICRKEWSVSYAHPAKSICNDCVGKQSVTTSDTLKELDHAPVAYMYNRAKYGQTDLRGQQWTPELSRLKPYTGNGMVRELTPLYTRPHARKPLTDEQILKVKAQFSGTLDVQFIAFTRAIEATHGIKE